MWRLAWRSVGCIQGPGEGSDKNHACPCHAGSIQRRDSNAHSKVAVASVLLLGGSALRCLGEDRNSFTFEGTCLKKRALLKAAEHPGKVLRAGSVHPRRYATNTSPTGASESCEGVGDCVHHNSQHTSALTQHTNSLQCTFLWSSPFTVSKDGDNFHGRAIRTEKQYLILRVVRHPDPEAVNTIGCME